MIKHITQNRFNYSIIQLKYSCVPAVFVCIGRKQFGWLIRLRKRDIVHQPVMPRISRNMKKFNIRDVRRAFRIWKESS